MENVNTTSRKKLSLNTEYVISINPNKSLHHVHNKLYNIYIFYVDKDEIYVKLWNQWLSEKLMVHLYHNWVNKFKLYDVYIIYSIQKVLYQYYQMKFVSKYKSFTIDIISILYSNIL